MAQLSRDDVIAILGPVDEDLVARIAATGATRAELAEAKVWAASDEALVNEHRSMPSGRVARLLDLLEAEDDDGEAAYMPGAGPHLPLV
jgi:hypothetical protein